MGIKIANLPPIVTPTSDDVLPISQNIAGARATYNINLNAIKTFVNAGATTTITVTLHISSLVDKQGTTAKH
jgi:hypothetical protein